MYITHSGRAGMFVCYTAVCCSIKFVVAGTQNPMVIYCFIKSFITKNDIFLISSWKLTLALICIMEVLI